MEILWDRSISVNAGNKDRRDISVSSGWNGRLSEKRDGQSSTSTFIKRLSRAVACSVRLSEGDVVCVALVVDASVTPG